MVNRLQINCHARLWTLTRYSKMKNVEAGADTQASSIFFITAGHIKLHFEPALSKQVKLSGY